jgi:glycosyltransferase involved in cell wall biosynthesis
VLLLGGDQVQGADRVELAMRTLAALLPEHPDARLLVTGRIGEPIEPLLEEFGLTEKIELVGRYAQRNAPALFRRAHVLLHTQLNDSCPTLVLEAMACGLPIVHPASGGTVELVGEEAGIGVPHPISFERHQPPAPEAFADAVSRALGRREELGVAARRRAVERFELARWLDRHAELFVELAGE